MINNKRIDTSQILCGYLRRLYGYRQDAVAAALHVSIPTLSKLENGFITPVVANNYKQVLANFYNWPGAPEELVKPIAECENFMENIISLIRDGIVENFRD